MPFAYLASGIFFGDKAVDVCRFWRSCRWQMGDHTPFGTRRQKIASA
ncbi:Uncharacterized protein ChrSV_4615 [Chromobacterium vaccinii]|nr:Uncharacterized protein ChrSW_4615 [Chromobacterium vaccinii]QND92071.1 Uncharacterized protein ChrSV_4615 [Chromobacterium vaccinii]